MDILVLNCGSSSLKYQLIDMTDEKLIAKGTIERIGIDGSNLVSKVPGRENLVVTKPIKNHVEAADLMFKTLTDPTNGVIKSLDEIGAIGHRALHGGIKFTESAIVDEKVKDVIRECFDLGPLHNPANLMGIEACEKNAPSKKNVAVFDTTFGMSMEEKAYLYAIPYEYYEKYNIRRYGFHGTSHMYVSNETIKFANLDKDKAKVIVCHLGNGASISASIGGKCVDTSMGLTPLEGLIMGTRSGDLDPAIVQYIANKEHKTVDEVLTILNKKSGLIGLSGVSSDYRDLKAKIEAGDKGAKRALDAMKYRIAKYIGSYMVALGGCDAITFTAGMGENQQELREDVCKYLEFLGVKIDKERNNTNGVPTLISTDDSKIKVYMIPTNEELMIARETLRLIGK
ncbi:MAG: acetate kinase [Lachnospiraceae bacterium]|nr:acetate kinase [Lachnospiraceae bacterium]